MKTIDIDALKREETRLVARTCLTVSACLHDLIENVTVIGGIVPSLLVDQDSVADGFEPHFGTQDLDLALGLAILENEAYREISQRLEDSGFTRDLNEQGNPAYQRWLHKDLHTSQVEFLIQSGENASPGAIHHLVGGKLAAVACEGIDLAFDKRILVNLAGTDAFGAKLSRNIWVCSAAPFIVLKAIAFRNRYEAKDAYDIYYILKHLPEEHRVVAEWFSENARNPAVSKAISNLEEDFSNMESGGPVRISHFLTGSLNDELQADAYGIIRQLLDNVRLC